MPTSSLPRLVIAIAWLAASPLLIAAVRSWKAAAMGDRSRRPALLVRASLINWLAFPLCFALGQIGGTHL